MSFIGGTLYLFGTNKAVFRKASLDATYEKAILATVL